MCHLANIIQASNFMTLLSLDNVKNNCIAIDLCLGIVSIYCVCHYFLGPLIKNCMCSIFVLKVIWSVVSAARPKKFHGAVVIKHCYCCQKAKGTFSQILSIIPFNILTILQRGKKQYHT